MTSSSDPAAPVAGAREPRSPQHWAVLAVAALATIGLAVLALALEPDPSGVGTHEQLGLLPCMAMDRFGVPCPGCGVTTSVTLAAQGRFADSFANQPLGFALAFALVAFALWSAVAHVAGRDLFRDLQRLRLGRLGLAVGALVVGAWIYKIWLVLGS